jgi:hypothetical protein
VSRLTTRGCHRDRIHWRRHHSSYRASHRFNTDLGHDDWLLALRPPRHEAPSNTTPGTPFHAHSRAGQHVRHHRKWIPAMEDNGLPAISPEPWQSDQLTCPRPRCAWSSWFPTTSRRIGGTRSTSIQLRRESCPRSPWPLRKRRPSLRISVDPGERLRQSSPRYPRSSTSRQDAGQGAQTLYVPMCRERESNPHEVALGGF